MARVSSVVKKQKSYISSIKPITINNSGGLAYIRDNEELLLQALMTTRFEKTYYTGTEDQVIQFANICKGFLKHDPVYFARAIIYAATNGAMRSAPIAGLAILSELTDKDLNGDSSKLFKAVFSKIITDPKRFLEFLDVLDNGVFGKGVGHRVKKAGANIVFNNLSEYHVIKYGSDNQGMSLKRALNICHPVPRNEIYNTLFKYILDSSAVKTSELKKLLPSIFHFEKFKETGDVSHAIEGKLPYEVVTSTKATPEVWEHIFNVAPFLNLLRNINNFDKYGILAKRKKELLSKLVDADAVRKSRVFPHQLFASYKFISDDEIKVAVTEAMEQSIDNMPNIAGDTYISVDCSGSMTAPIAENSKLTVIECATLFASTLFKMAQRAKVNKFTTHVTAFANDCRPVALTHRDSIVRHMSTISNANSGGTDLGSAVKYLVDKKLNVAQAIFITDNESWADWMQRSPTAAKKIETYHNKVNMNTQFIFLQMLPYKTAQVPPEFKNCHIVYGWSDEVIKRIAAICMGNTNQVEEVKNTYIPGFDEPVVVKDLSVATKEAAAVLQKAKLGGKVVKATTSKAKPVTRKVTKSAAKKSKKR